METYRRSSAPLSHVTMLSVMAIVFLELFLPYTAKAAIEEPYVTMARCRIQCLKQFVPEPKQTDDNACWDTNNYRTSYNQDCAECWHLCKTFITSPSFMGPACLSIKHCGEACHTACSFIADKPQALPMEGDWKFIDMFKSGTDTHEMSIHWKPPILDSSNPQSALTSETKLGPIVYVLLSRNSNKPQEGWAVVQLMVSTSIRIDLDSIPLSPEFLLLAVSEHGLIAQFEFKTESLILGDIYDPSGPQLDALRNAVEPSWYMKALNDMSVNISLTKIKVREEGGSYWSQTAEISVRGPDWLGQNTEHFFSLRWFLIDCKDAYYFVPSCSLPRDDYGATVHTKGTEEVSYDIKNLRFNSIYQLVIYLTEDYRIKAELVFKTDPCVKPDSLQLTRCLDNINEVELPSIPIVYREDLQPDPPVLQLYLNISSMTLQPHSDLVLVNITWSPVLNESTDSYNVTTYKEDKNLLVSRYVTTSCYMVLQLQQNTQYHIKVEAVPKLQQDEGFASQLFDEILINTSDVNLAVYQGPQAFRFRNNDEMDQVDGIIIGVTCFIIVFVLGVLAAVLYKKRESFKDIIVTKATVAKSNSYKSNVGGKSDYSNQLIVFSDEWELDPKKLAFSTLLGQGAFGKVVTGYYDDQKVAIKLVREGAPMSYKEDLVAEINLMKRLGNHPNIVCLIGACTMSEPIALVMEYVPYGNLQNFLKKCRLEGDLRKREDGPAEITYTAIQESGCMESGVVTPANILSFARQVAMAMEYLTEKKYVHRDLAARNVLIDYNKVVKVCDFGLSRDIFNDNHYKKLTNGKLPLKWMAIESLRDRMFTTQSDVWSFGILLWEIVTMGASPYPNVALADLYYVLSNGYRMDRPSNCSPELYAIMRSCWEEEPCERPNFIQLRVMIENLLLEDRNYLVLEDIDVPLTNSDSSSSPLPLHESDTGQTSAGSDGAAIGPPVFPTISANPSTNSSCATKTAKKTSPRKDNMRINVCIHQKSTDRLIRPSESDSSPSSC